MGHQSISLPYHFWHFEFVLPVNYLEYKLEVNSKCIAGNKRSLNAKLESLGDYMRALKSRSANTKAIGAVKNEVGSAAA